MEALLVTCRDPFRPANHRSVAVLRRGRRIRALAPKTRQPFICLYNGRPLLRAAWRRRVRDGDTVAFVLLPQGGSGGGGGSNPMRIVLQIAIAFIAPEIAVGLLGQTLAGTAVIGSITMGQIVGGIIGMGLNLLVGALIPTPKQSSSATFSASGGLASPSPTYALSAQGNLARLGQPIPSMYGRHIVYPDFAAAPYAEYAGNEQFLYQLFCIGQGEYEVEAIRIEDTTISSFDEITYELVAPGGSVTLFPTEVETSGEVAGQEALTSTTLGPFVANDAGTVTNALAIDVVMGRGVYYATDSGGLSSMTVQWHVEARTIDDSGTPTGSFFTLGTESYTAATTTPQRKSYRYSVPSARYEVQFTRLDTKQTDSRYGHELAWTGLRAYLPSTQDYGQVTLLAMRLRATNNLSQQASRKINVIATRKLQTWSAGAGWSTSAVATRSPAWAFADVCRAAYGAQLADARIDLEALVALAATWASRGDTFDGVFDSQGTVWEALTQIARAGRAVPYIQGGIVHCVRDEAATLPVAMFSQRNILRNSLKLQYLFASEETADAVDVAYFDESTWTERIVRAELAGGTSDRPAQIKLFGVVDRDQAWREGMYVAAANRYRRRLITFGTEMEGFIPSLGDLIAVQHDLPRWGQSGEVVAWVAGTKTATLSEPLDWSAGGPHKLAFRTRGGSPSGPYTATAGVDVWHVVLSDWVSGTDPTPDTGATRERSHFAFGPADEEYILARVLGVKPKTPETVEIAAVVESDYVHTADTGSAPTDSAWQLPARFTVPVVLGLSAYSMPEDPSIMLLSWQPAPGADHYLVEVSNGDGTWTRMGEVAAANFSATAIYGPSTLIRVAAVGMTRGPWVQIAYGAAASYMWNAVDTTLMWGTSTDPMWEY